MVHPVKKRGRPAEDIWPDGSITKIVFENFLTYGHHVECMPGPNLNVIIGSNGTGKSTIICAICLAMGGSPKLLGRSERFSDYIKHGQDSGSVEITMSDSKKSTPPVIRLEIRRPNSTQYFIDGRKVTLKQLREFVDTYNIQIENPCTFLAQDKVKSFSEQNPQLLLENTERAGRPDLLEMHEELKKNRNGGKELEASCADLERRIGAIRASMTVLEPRVKNFNEREKMHEKVALLEKKESLLVYEEMRKLYDERKKELSKVQQEIAQARAFLQPLQKEIEELKKKVADRIEVLRKLRHTKSGSVQEIDNLKTRLERCEQEVERVRLQYQRSVEEAQQYDSRISNTQQEIRVVEEQLEACSHSNAVDLRPEIKRLQVEYDKLDKKEEEIDQKQEGLQRDERQLKQRFNGLFNAI
uniref:Structural maintenance of chromosomes protein 5 n=2 Tax=Plectus sambesii TaxID=2011161 RepID=A0A914V7U7_9BILA